MACQRHITRFLTFRALPWPRGGAFFYASRPGTRNSIWAALGNFSRALSRLACMRPTPESRKPPPATKGALGVFAILVALLPGCRQDMHVQPRYQPEDPSNFFTDGRYERP